MAEAAVAAPAVEQEKKDAESQEAAGGEGLGSARPAEEAAKRDEEQPLGRKAEQASAPTGQPSSEPALTCAGLDTGIVIEELISNEAEGKGDEAEVQVPMGKNSIEVQDPAGGEEQQQQQQQQPASGPTITTTVGENEAVIVLGGGDAAGAEAGQNEKAQKSCVVNMASLDEEQKGKKAAGKKETPAKTNGSARSKKTAEAAAAKPTAEPKKRGRKPGSGKKQNSPPKVDLAAQPFTPAQQMQLRAQILVYGALIQSTLPDESLMSASYFDASKVRGTESHETYYSAAKPTWDKTWKAAFDRIKKATGQAPKLVSFAAAHVPPGIRSPAATGATTFASPGLPPKSGSTKAGGKTNNSAPPTGADTGYSSMASATVASWSARNRAPDPNSWNLYAGAPPPRFPFPQGSPPPPTTMGPWGVASTPGYFSPTAFPATPPAFAQPVPLAAAPADGGEPQAKRRKVAGDMNNGTTQLGDADKLEESVRAVEQARRTAEDMATASDSVVQQSHRVWKEMKDKVTSNSATAKEAQVAACMAAITAASSVARAASAAANVAYAAAMQAKAMAIEAAKARDEDPSVTHVMQGEDQFIAGVKEAARSQAKSAFLIAQQAENIGAIVRAAEMASAAARQASSIMAIGNLGAEKSPKAKNNSNNSSSSNRKNSVRGGRGQVGRGKKNEDPELPKGEKASELANTNTNDAVMEDAEQQQQNAEPAEGMVEDRQQFKPTDIKEGSHVEIKPGEEEGLKGVWFSAKVLEIKEDQALVVYDDLLDEDGQGDHLKEWVDLTSHSDNVPRVRIAHPMTAEASAKKKRRAAMGNQIWLKGDHVDVWMRDGWWEGIVQSAEDEKVTVFFPADGDSDVTKSWNMRPSLIWHEGAWFPWRETRKEKMEAGNSQDDSTDMETPRPRSGAKPTKRKKFSDVMEKEHEQRKRLLEEQAKSMPKSGSKRKKPSSDRKRSTGSEVTSDAEADVKKSTNRAPAISKSTSKGAAKKHGS